MVDFNDDLKNEDLIPAPDEIEQDGESGSGYEEFSGSSGFEFPSIKSNDKGYEMENSTFEFGHIILKSIWIGSIILCIIVAVIVIITSLLVLLLSKCFENRKPKQPSDIDYWKWWWSDRSRKTPPKLKRNFERKGIDKSKFVTSSHMYHISTTAFVQCLIFCVIPGTWDLVKASKRGVYPLQQSQNCNFFRINEGPLNILLLASL